MKVVFALSDPMFRVYMQRCKFHIVLAPHIIVSELVIR